MADKVVEYYPDGHFPNDKFVECRTRIKRDDTVHRVMYYMDLPKNDDESLARYKVPLSDIIALGITTLGYRVGSKPVFDDPSSWDENGNLTTKAVEFIQSEANGITAEKRQAAPRKKTEEKVKESLAQAAGFDNVEDFLAAIAKLKKSKK